VKEGVKYLVALSFPLIVSGGCAGAGDLLNQAGSGLGGIPGVRSLTGGAGAANTSSVTGAVNKEVSKIVGVDSPMPAVLAAVQSEGKADIASIYSDDIDGDDAALARAERGRVAQIVGNEAASVSEFEKAIEKIREFEDRATVSAGDVASHAAALVVNDTMIPYEPAGFEKVLAYHFQALNYLMQGKVEDAGVEVRRANAEQERALKQHEQELLEAEQEAKEKGFKPSDLLPSLRALMSKDAVSLAGKVKNSFQNAYTFYMSGVVREALNEPNDAYIDYKKALEIAPNNTFIQRDVARLAKSLGMTSDASVSAKVLGNAKVRDASKAEVIVLLEDDLVPEKAAAPYNFPLPIPGITGLKTMPIATYQAVAYKAQPAVLKSNGKEVARTENICSIDALAVKAYEESAPARVTRQVVRSAIKAGATGAAAVYGGVAAGTAAGLLSSATEQADTRSWRSLPQNAQVLRTEVAPGAQLELVHQGSGAKATIDAQLQAGKTLVVRATRIGGKLFVKSVTL
jgi:hypothetical protein